MAPRPLSFKDCLIPRPTPRGIDVVSLLHHFAIVTYAVDPVRLRSLIDPRFELLMVEVNGQERALISIVPFTEVNFGLAAYPSPRFRFNQTNYRIYVTDTKTGDHCVWFIGSLLHSITVLIPRYIWKLPWHYGQMQFDCELHGGYYKRYKMTTRSSWADAELELVTEPGLRSAHHGFPDDESALAYLTHPLKGYYYRRDGRLGSYSVWHDRLNMQPAHLKSARFDVLDRLGIASLEEQQKPYSVLVQPETEFTVYLPLRQAWQLLSWLRFL